MNNNATQSNFGNISLDERRALSRDLQLALETNHGDIGKQHFCPAWGGVACGSCTAWTGFLGRAKIPRSTSIPTPVIKEKFPQLNICGITVQSGIVIHIRKADSL